MEVETAKAFGRTFIKGNIPEINAVRCLACSNCVDLCKKLGPNVLEIVGGVARPVRPEDCISDGACMLSCPDQGDLPDQFVRSGRDAAITAGLRTKGRTGQGREASDCLAPR